MTMDTNLLLKKHDEEILSNTIFFENKILDSKEKVDRNKKVRDEMKEFLKIGKKFIDR